MDRGEIECDEGSELEVFCCCSCIAWLEDSCLAWLLRDDEEGVAVPGIPDGRNIKLLMMLLLLFWLL